MGSYNQCKAYLQVDELFESLVAGTYAAGGDKDSNNSESNRPIQLMPQHYIILVNSYVQRGGEGSMRRALKMFDEVSAAKSIVCGTTKFSRKTVE